MKKGRGNVIVRMTVITNSTMVTPWELTSSSNYYLWLDPELPSSMSTIMNTTGKSIAYSQKTQYIFRRLFSA